ncbi:MAG TPA: CotH kinase family protein [Candidatus Saccharimonadales bacterium]|nr:CotH kinase family protein [Candidatus Saccharimonadales bacterium]
MAADKKESADDLFAPFRVIQLKIEVPVASLESLKIDPKKYVRATLKEGNTILADAGVRLKGNGAFQSLEKKPNLTFKFNEFVSGEKFHGNGKLFFENAHQDPSLLCSFLGSEIFRAANVPAPRVAYAKVEMNGKDVGIYLITETVNRDFLSQYYKKSKGNLYVGANGDITDKLEKDGGDESKDQPDLKALASACREQDPAARIKKTSSLLDLDRFISFAAVEDFLWNSSGYSMGRNNYRVYHDPNSNLISFIPHGLEQLFANPKGAVFPEWRGLVARNILETPEGQRRYREQLGKILAGPGKVETLTARISELSKKIRPLLPRDESKTFDAAVTMLKQRIAQRWAFIDQELKKPEPTATAPPKT